MCGIAGILAFDGASPTRAQVEAMADRIAHRGPDGEGAFVEGPVALGHRRLSIIDLETGDQPMRSRDGRFVIVYNGEIYNFAELRGRLSEDGYPFRTRSDTEVILALHELEGPAGIRRLRGMFAYALWDGRERRLTLVRDRVGIKPLYYARLPDRLVFASELKAITAAFPGLARIDPTAVNFYFSRQYIGGHGTVYNDVHKVLPGCYLEVDAKGSVRKSAYWSLPGSGAREVKFRDAKESTSRLLSDAVGCHLVSDVPVGVFLSGGLDSGALLACAAEAAEGPLQTFSVGFGPHSSYNETGFARTLADRFGTQHHEIDVTEAEMLGALPHVIRNMDQPLADYAVLPTYVMSRFAAERVKVVLSGEGADEVFGGYRRYHLYALLDRTGLHRLFPGRLPGPSVFDERSRRRLLNPDVFLSAGDLPQEQKLSMDKRAMNGAGAVNSMLYTDLSNWLVDDLLMKVDNMGMLASIEARVPYLDHLLLEHVAALPGRFKATLMEKKRLLRAVSRRRLPAEILSRRKHGFTVPVGEWLREPLQPMFEEAVLDDAANAEWLDLPFVARLFKSHLHGRDVGLGLWAVLVFCLWRRREVVRNATGG